MTDDAPSGALAARAAALAVLERVERDAFADAALADVLRGAGLPARDRGLATRLTYGVLAWRRLLDWHLTRLTTRPLATLDPALLQILRVGLYQILLLDRVPSHAAVATSVELAKRTTPAAAGLVNAVLRRAVREGGRRPAPTAPDPDEALAIATSHPTWLVHAWRARFGAERLRALLLANNEAAPTVLRARPGGRDALVAALADAGITGRPGRFAPDAVVLPSGPMDPHALPGFDAGRFVVQSEASQLVAELVDAAGANRVLDACAAPGGKTTLLAERAPAAIVVALDRHLRRTRVVAAASRRLGLGNVAAVTADARRAAALLPRARFDRILVDAPCTGLGTLRSHPELRWRRATGDAARLAVLQRELLEAVTPLLAPGGALVYATCTLTREENEGVVGAWLAHHPALAVDPAGAHLPAAAAALVTADGALLTLPERDGLDGFYAVRIVRNHRETGASGRFANHP